MSSQTTRRHTRRRLRLPLIRDTLLAGAVAAGVITALAAVARAANVTFEVDEEAIPLGAFPFWISVATIATIAIAVLIRTRRRFYAITLTATALSLGPPLFLADDADTAITLVAAHLLAAAIIIPVAARHLHASPTQAPGR